MIIIDDHDNTAGLVAKTVKTLPIPEIAELYRRTVAPVTYLGIQCMIFVRFFDSV